MQRLALLTLLLTGFMFSASAQDEPESAQESTVAEEGEAATNENDEAEADAADDGRLELHEILALRLDADLVTLSACETGLGSGYFAELPAGDDFVGLTRAFLYAGSTSVLATLWEVDDASTLSLMKNFYAGLRRSAGAEDMANALSLAQRALLSSKEYSHPYFWAPFVLVGEMGRDRHAET